MKDEENYDLSENQIETISYNIYKDIEQYIKNNMCKYRIWRKENFLKDIDIKVALELGIIKIIKER